MSATIEAESKEQISRFLPDALATALTSYQAFMEQAVPKEAHEFIKHHNAGKAAIAHIELLLKFARWADLPDATALDHNNQIILAAMLQEAGDELRAHCEHNGEHNGERDGEQDE